MIVSPAWAGKRYAVLGLARSGKATVRALVAAGAEVTAWDSDADKRQALVDAVQESIDLDELALHVADPELIDLSGFDALVVSPGVPLNRHPLAAKARAAGVPIIGDIELFAQGRASLPPHKVVGVTGTNGKSTTVSLIHHILTTAGIPSRLGGNIGLPILGQEPLAPNDHGVGVYVLELSSYQIDLTQTLDCDVAVLLNITPDHLDRYKGFDDYRASKLRLFKMMSPPHIGVLNWHTDIGERLYRVLYETHPCEFWSKYDDNVDDPYDLWGAFDKHGQTASRDHLSTQRNWPNLQGPHNAQNAISAILACSALGVVDEMMSAALTTYAGLPHRMERVRTCGGVAYINDSKATNPDSTAPALAAFERIHWILGGQAKTDDLHACAPSFGRVARAYTIGAAAAKFAHLLQGKVPVEQSGTLDVAVISAAAQARAGDTVLLSPACASFDQFRDFEDRGDRFRRLVEAL